MKILWMGQLVISYQQRGKQKSLNGRPNKISAPARTAIKTPAGKRNDCKKNTRQGPQRQQKNALPQRQQKKKKKTRSPQRRHKKKKTRPRNDSKRKTLVPPGQGRARQGRAGRGGARQGKAGQEANNTQNPPKLRTQTLHTKPCNLHSKL